MLAMAGAEPLSFRAWFADQLGEALRLNLPVLVRLEDAAEGWAPWGVIVSMRGEWLELIDPIGGKHTVRRSRLEPMVGQAIVLYLDPRGFTGLGPGDRGDPVAQLQRWMSAEGFYQGPLDGIYGPLTRQGVRQVQQRAGLEPSGQINMPTAAWIGSRLNPRGPSLD
jgi:hypothetical protein